MISFLPHAVIASSINKLFLLWMLFSNALQVLDMLDQIRLRFLWDSTVTFPPNFVALI